MDYEVKDYGLRVRGERVGVGLFDFATDGRRQGLLVLPAIALRRGGVAISARG